MSEKEIAKRVRRGSEVGGFAPEVLDQLLQGVAGEGKLASAEDLQSLLRQLSGALLTRALDAEMTHHLGYEKGQEPPEAQDNRRNGKGEKRVRTNHGEIAVEVPRDREGSFEPQLLPKHQRQFKGFDDKILAMYARGMSVRDIRAHLDEIYGVDVSPDLISRVTDGVLDELKAWQERPLERVYCVVYLDALIVKIRDNGTVRNKAVFVAVGVPADGTREVLGLWVQATEGAAFWSSVLEELRRRGVEDILVLCSDGITGMSQAVEAIFPQTVFQTCVVHVIRASTRYVPWKERKAVCADLREVYTAKDEAAAEAALRRFEDKWDSRYPTVAKTWRRRWAEIIPFLAYPAEMRRAIYTTNAVEALNRNFRKAAKTRGHFPTDDAAIKLLYLTLRHGQKETVRRSREWNMALNQFAIYFEGRLQVG
jgi:putative transposase